MHITSSLSEPFNHRAAIESLLRQDFPRAWERTYFFDPQKPRSPEHEASLLFSRLSKYWGIPGRQLQDFVNAVAQAIRAGNCTVVTTSEVTYLVPAIVKDRAQILLEIFFGEKLLKGQNLQQLARFYEEFLTDHELAHAVERSFPERFSQTPRQSERLADSFSTLKAVCKHGQKIAPLLDLVAKGRVYQADNTHQTAGAIRAAVTFAQEKGTKALRRMSNTDLFETAQRLSFVN